MASKTLSSIIAGSPILLPPVTLTEREMRGEGTGTLANLTFHGLLKTGQTSSTTLTEVLNISGRGIIQFLAITSSSTAVVGSMKWRIVIDGVTVLDKVSGAVRDDRAICAVGGILAGGSSGTDDQILTFEAIPFLTSLVVSQAGDGSDGVVTLYSRYLT